MKKIVKVDNKSKNNNILESKKKLIQKILMRSNREVSVLFKSVAHPMRIKILSILLSGPVTFAKLKDTTELSKTALSNHLKQLMDNKLIIKIDRGVYELTDNGKQLLIAAGSVYRNIKESDITDIDEMQLHYTAGFHYIPQSIKKIDSFEILPNAKFRSSWVSYLGSISGVLKSLEKDFDIVDVAGYSGYCFVTNIMTNELSPAGPTAHVCWSEILKGTSLLGWNVHIKPYDKQFPENDLEDLTEKDIQYARRVFEDIKSEIETHKRPVILWGPVIPEYGIVNGYTKDKYRVSTFRWLHKELDEPINFTELKAPGILHYIYFRKKNWSIDELFSKDTDQIVLSRAIKFASGISVSPKNYVSGPRAYDIWAQNLVNSKNTDKNYHANSYVGVCTQEAKGLSAIFFARMSARYQGTKIGEILSEIIMTYQLEEKYMRQFTQLFPFAFSGDLSKNKCKEGAELLKLVKDKEIIAIDKMKQILKLLEN